MMNTANIYIYLLKKIKESGGAVPPELVAEVEALDVTVNGDDTTEPPTPGLKDRVGDLETTVNGDSTTTPPIHGLLSRVSELECNNYNGQVDIKSYTVSDPYVTPSPGYARAYKCDIRLGDNNNNVLLFNTTSSTDFSTVYVPKGTKI